MYLLPRPGKNVCDFLGDRYSDLFHCFNLQRCADAFTSQTGTEQIHPPSSYGTHFRKGNGGGWFCFRQSLLWEREIVETRGPKLSCPFFRPKINSLGWPPSSLLPAPQAAGCTLLFDVVQPTRQLIWLCLCSLLIPLPEH